MAFSRLITDCAPPSALRSDDITATCGHGSSRSALPPDQMLRAAESERDSRQGGICEARGRENGRAGDEQPTCAPDFPVRVDDAGVRVGAHAYRSDVMAALRHERALDGARQIG